MREELTYFGFLLGSVVLGGVCGRVPAGNARLWFSSAVGFLITTVFCGRNALHPFITMVGNALIITFIPDCHKWSMVFSFGYLGFFRSATFFGLPATAEFVNAIELILILKTIGIAFEVNDTKLRKKGLAPFATSSPNFSPLNSHGNVSPDFMDVIHYCLCFMGIMTGPYYKYKVFHDMINSTQLHNIPREKMALERLRMLPCYVMIFLTMSTVFDFSMLWSEEFYGSTATYRFLYLVALFVYFRMKFYIAWLVAEASCIACGLGVYPAVCKPKPGHGPTEPEKIPEKTDDLTEFSYETIYNIDEHAVEFVPTAREALKAWNMTVQYWLAWHIYRRVPIKSIRTVLVMFVSAYWHGLHGGYYLGLLSVPLFLMAENWLTKYDNFWAKFVNWFLRMRAFEYMSIGFICLTGARTLRYWNSIYFSGHLIAILIFVIGQIFRKLTRQSRHQAGGGDARISAVASGENSVKAHAE